MRKFILPFAGAVGLFLAACLAAPGEPSATSNSALTCATDERSFNGSCRKTCGTSAECASPNTCMTVSSGLALCLDYSACAYLSSDTECAGVPYGSYESVTAYGSADNFDPYWSPTYDPYDTSYGSYGSYGGTGSSEPFGCGGNAVWHTAPPVATDDPKCGQAHPVTRCQRVGNRCSIVAGTTMDVADH